MAKEELLWKARRERQLWNMVAECSERKIAIEKVELDQKEKSPRGFNGCQNIMGWGWGWVWCLTQG